MEKPSVRLRTVIYDFRQDYRGVAMAAAESCNWHASVYDDPFTAMSGFGEGVDALIIPHERTVLRPTYKVDSPAGYMLNLALNFGAPVAVLAESRTPDLEKHLNTGTAMNAVIPTGEGTSIVTTARAIEPKAYLYIRSALEGWLETVAQIKQGN